MRRCPQTRAGRTARPPQQAPDLGFAPRTSYPACAARGDTAPGPPGPVFQGQGASGSGLGLGTARGGARALPAGKGLRRGGAGRGKGGLPGACEGAGRGRDLQGGAREARGEGRGLGRNGALGSAGGGAWGPLGKRRGQWRRLPQAYGCWELRRSHSSRAGGGVSGGCGRPVFSATPREAGPRPVRSAPPTRAAARGPPLWARRGLPRDQEGAVSSRPRNRLSCV